jgi:hypothetical protein
MSVDDLESLNETLNALCRNGAQYLAGGIALMARPIRAAPALPQRIPLRAWIISMMREYWTCRTEREQWTTGSTTLRAPLARSH